MGEWRNVRLGDCIKEINERTIENNQYEVLTSSKNGIYSQEEYFDKQVASKDNTGYKIIKKGQFTYRSMSDNGTFTINRLENKEIGIVSPAYPVFEVTNINAEYLKYYFQSDEFKKSIYNLSQGSTRTALKYKNLADIEMLVPTFEEQEKIVKILNKIDKILIDIQNKNNEMNKYRDYCLEKLLSKGLNNDEWEKGKLGEFLKIYRGGSPRPISSFITTNENGINWIKIGDTTNNSKYIYSTKERITVEGVRRSRMVYENEFLLSNSMSFGKPYILKTNGCVHDGWLVLKEYEEKFDIDFLYYLLSSYTIQKQYKRLASGTGVENLNKDLVASVNVIVPTMKEQKTIAYALDKFDKIINKNTEKIERYKEFKKTLMQKLLTGKVKVKI